MSDERVPRPLPYGWTGQITAIGREGITMVAPRYFNDPTPITLEFVPMPPGDMFFYGGSLYRHEADCLQLVAGIKA